MSYNNTRLTFGYRSDQIKYDVAVTYNPIVFILDGVSLPTMPHSTTVSRNSIDRLVFDTLNDKIYLVESNTVCEVSGLHADTWKILDDGVRLSHNKLMLDEWQRVLPINVREYIGLCSACCIL